MSWDLYAMELPAGARCVDDIPQDFSPGSLGSRLDLVDLIVSVVPEADFTDPSYGRISGDGFSVTVAMANDPVDCIAFHVRGGDAAAGVVADVLGHLGLRALDTGAADGALFGPGSSAASLQAWRAYRDRVIGR